MAAPLLKTKLYIPHVRPGLVPRPRLLERLDEGTQSEGFAKQSISFVRKLTLISAPAGFGKTTFLANWINQTNRRVAWLSLDAEDNDPVRFWFYLIAALQTVRAGIGQAGLAELQSPQSPSIESVLTGLVNEIIDTDLAWILVLDDFHVITEPDINHGLVFLLEHLPPQMHLILATRADPPWPLARLRARGRMIELRTEDLRFTADEAAVFLNTCVGLNLSSADVALLDARTEGWIAGLQLAALSMRGRKDVPGFIKAFTGTHRFVLDYLVEEVLDQQSPGIQEFLLKTSVLERMTAPLCDVVTDGSDSQTILIQLDRDNLFLIPLDGGRRWYRYHHLFADLLRGRLELTQPDRVPTLHRRASQWYEEKGLIAEAVGHALAANDIERVVRLVAGNALSLIYHGELRALMRQLAALPDEVVCSQPWLCVARAWTLAYAGEFDGVEPLLQQAEESLAGLDEHKGEPALGETEGRRMVGHIATIRAYAAALKGEMSQAAELAREALQHLPAGDWMVRGYTTTLLGAVLRPCGDLVAAAEACDEAITISQAAGDSYFAAVALCDLAALHFVRGELRKAAAACQDVQQIADRYGQRGGRPLPVLGYAYIRLSAVLREWNDLETAMHYAREGLELCEQWGQADVLVYGYSEVAKVLQASGDADGALNTIQKGKWIASSVSPWPGLHVVAEQARLWLAQGNLGAASRWALENGLGIHDTLSFQHLFRYIVLVRVLIAQGAFHKAVQLLARLLEAAEMAGANGYVIEILVLQALAQHAQCKMDTALTALERVLSLAEPEGYVRTFIDEGAPMKELLRQAVTRGIAPQYVSRLLSALGETPSQPHTATFIEPLSERELEVLQLLTTQLPHAEIAAELYVSINTVRSHVKNIYSKLDVHNRMEAVQRAEKLGLV
ncbi:MAG: hypothetical protein JXR84_00020 [Anaerolineae bacterium]|nr:hypothetical protein [Anaerolineae bacterium]